MYSVLKQSCSHGEHIKCSPARAELRLSKHPRPPGIQPGVCYSPIPERRLQEPRQKEELKRKRPGCWEGWGEKHLRPPPPPPPPLTPYKETRATLWSHSISFSQNSDWTLVAAGPPRELPTKTFRRTQEALAARSAQRGLLACPRTFWWATPEAARPASTTYRSMCDSLIGCGSAKWQAQK